MANILSGPAQYLTRFGEQTIAGSQYAMTKLGVDRSHCSLKIEEYLILCVPFQLGFKRSIFLASLSRQELSFFQRYVNTSVGLSLTLNPDRKSKTPIKFFIRSNLTTVGQMKDRENVGLFVIDYKNSPDEMVVILGNYMENYERIKTQYDDYGNTSVRMTQDVAKFLGYNMFATLSEPAKQARRIQVFSINSKSVEHMEAAGSPILMPGTPVIYQLFFKKYRVTVTGKISHAETVSHGLVRTVSNLDFSPELVEILNDYWYKAKTNSFGI